MSESDPTAQPRLRSDAEIQAYSLQKVEPYAQRVVIEDYDSAWPVLYEREAARIRSILGEQVVQLEHCGSTSVPGLPAKPRIDMVMAVPDSNDEDAYVPPMEAAGYPLRIREPEWFAHRVFKGPDTDINLHVFTAGCPEIERMLLFRDRLRENEADRELYAETKRELAKRDWRFVQHYADAKTDVVKAILARATAASGEPR